MGPTNRDGGAVNRFVGYTLVRKRDGAAPLYSTGAVATWQDADTLAVGLGRRLTIGTVVE